MALQYSSTLPSAGVITTSLAASSVPLLTDCSQHSSQPITNFGHQLLLQPQFAFGPGQGLPVLEAGGNVAVSGADLNNPAAYGIQLQHGPDLSHIGFPAGGQPVSEPGLLPHDKKKTGKSRHPPPP